MIIIVVILVECLLESTSIFRLANELIIIFVSLKRIQVVYTR